MSLSVIIVTFNNEKEIRACIEAAESAAKGLDCEVIVVDNASTDRTLDVLEQSVLIRLYRSPRNIGFAGAVNAAASLAVKDFVLLLNPDALVDREAFHELLAYARRHPDRLPLGGRSFHPGGALDPRACWGLPSVWSTACFAFGLSTVFKRSRLFDPESMGRWGRDDDRTVGVVTGSLLLMRADVWKRLEGFDPRYFMYGEDTDLSLRTARLGYRPGIVPSAVYSHPSGASSTQVGKLLLVLTGKATYMRKNWSRPRASLGTLLLQVGVALRAMAESAGRRPPLWAEAWRSRSAWRGGFERRLGALDELVEVIPRGR